MLRRRDNFAEIGRRPLSTTGRRVQYCTPAAWPDAEFLAGHRRVAGMPPKIRRHGLEGKDFGV